MALFDFDELQIYRGSDIPVTESITVKIPTLEDIATFGEKEYFSAVHTYTSVGADLKYQLWDIGIDYTEIEDYDLFINLISQIMSAKPQNENGDKDKQVERKNPVSLFLKDIDFAEFETYKYNEKDIVLYNKDKDIVFGRTAYLKSVELIRLIHGLKRNDELPGNERTKMDMIQDARDEAMAAKSKPYKSALKPLISTLQVKCGQCGDDKVWNMPVSMFFENIRRIGKIQDAECLLNGAYSGFASLKGVDKNRLNMFNDI